MYSKIENDYLTAEINDLGAELSSLKLNSDGYEYIWQGHEQIWRGRAPVLFPVIGQLKNDLFIYGGHAYPMKKHGFARNSLFKQAEIDSSRVTFILSSDADTRTSFPFDFELEVCFELVGRALKCTEKVTNTGSDIMYFSLGAHPGFNCGSGSSLAFEEVETGLSCEKIDRDNLLIDKSFPLDLIDGKILKLTEHIFDEDALILSELNSSVVTLNNSDNIHNVRFDFGDAPFLGLWAKPGAPYVCIEPWYGINDSHEIYNDISEKRGILSLEPEETSELVWIAEL